MKKKMYKYRYIVEANTKYSPEKRAEACRNFYCFIEHCPFIGKPCIEITTEDWEELEVKDEIQNH